MNLIDTKKRILKDRDKSITKTPNLFDRLKDEYREKLYQQRVDYPNLTNEVINAFKAERSWTEIKYGFVANYMLLVDIQTHHDYIMSFK